MPNHPLDYAPWESLATVHAPFAQVHGDARRFPADVSPFVALREPTESAFIDLTHLVAPEETVGLGTKNELTVPTGWELEFDCWLDQMIYEGPRFENLPAVVELTVADVPQMLALTELTEPGPFKPRTIEMGRYIGIKTPDGTLAAMAGERLKTPDFTEISAVCTHPDHRGQGYGATLLRTMVNHIVTQGQTPFLHVKTENGAKQLYEKLGFRLRSEIRLSVVKRLEEN